MSSPRLSAIAALGALTVVLSGCVGEQQTAVGIDDLQVAVLGTVDPAQQAFLDRMDELSEGTIAVQVSDNFAGSGGEPAEVALAKAVVAGEVDVAWVPIRALSAIGIDGLDALEAPLLIRTHDQQRAVALGVPGELITTALRNSDIAGLALIPGPQQYPVAAGAPLIAVADWAGKTVQVSSLNPVETATVETLGATASADGPSTVADLVAGSAQVSTANPAELLPGGAVAAGPFLTSNVALWPEMSIIIVNRDVLERLSNRQRGFLDGSVVRAQDAAMAAPDVSTTIADACAAGVKFGTLTPDQLTELEEALAPVYETLKGDPADARLLEAIQDAVKRNAGTGALSVAKKCRWTPPDA